MKHPHQVPLVVYLIRSCIASHSCLEGAGTKEFDVSRRDEFELDCTYCLDAPELIPAGCTVVGVACFPVGQLFTR